MASPTQQDEVPEFPVRPGTSDDPTGPREIECPGDPGPTVLIPAPGDPRMNPKIPAPSKPGPPGI
ncbi:hypothetical protein AKJ09_01863 [Labilithrix luteola]|uniref:Uncharacterized protein n=1 Tax=Labilithrix luteola TaxID=1391654 RepID=A0A0K1PQ06_9BACT|nr:hypothetical protein [Labilithrix luteola]AKU95199.1 hypothetical protein AKJ09_01863 [Labilithrix luteola]